MQTIMRRTSQLSGKHSGKACLCTLYLTLLLILLNTVESIAQNPVVPIGSWRLFLNYQSATGVVKGDKLYCSTPTNLFSLDAVDEVEMYTKISGLSDIGVSCMGWDASTNQLAVIYNNSNVDILEGSSIRNISDILNSTISGNKTIYAVYCLNGIAYLSSGLGVILVDLKKYEIKDTWFISDLGSQVKVNAFTSDDQFYYAATGEGLKKAPINSNNPADYHNWPDQIGNNLLSAGTVLNVINTNSKIIALKNDSLFIQNNDQWQFLYADSNWPIVNITSGTSYFTVCQRNTSGASRVITMDTAAQIVQTLAVPNVISYPEAAIIDHDTTWVADLYGGLTAFKNNSTYQRFIPNGPPGIATGDMVFQKDTLFAAAGAVDASWNYTYDRNGVYSFAGNLWNFQGYYNTPALDSVLDFITLAPDPGNGSLWAGSYGGGLVNFNGNQLSVYKQNSALQAAVGDPTSYRVSGLAFDHSNNLWIGNYGAPQNLKVLKSNGEWRGFTIPFYLTENAISQIVVDDANQLWMVSPKGNGVICYNYGSNIDSTQDDQWRYFQTGIGTGNLPSNNVYCLAKDKNSLIWIGTDNGIAVVQCATSIFTQYCDAVLPVIQQDQIAGYLFQNETVQCIAVDGANRKWVGTTNGVWLISADGDKVIYNFTTANSPLLHNNVFKITIDPITGEVYMATFLGICSFRSTATEATQSDSNVLVFPNPVPPHYNGTIGIRGLADNSLVKIAELNGRLIYETRALGGQAVWDGKDYKGNTILPGVYLVLVRTDDGTEKAVTKIVIIGGK